MSLNARNTAYEVPDTFDFGLEERPEEDQPDKEEPHPLLGVMTHEVKYCPDVIHQDAEPEHRHDWHRKPEEEQTLADEDKVIWHCGGCGEIAIHYSWHKP